MPRASVLESACVKLDLLDTVGYVLIHLATLGRGGLRRWTLGKSRDFQVYSSWLLATPALEASSSWASWRRMPVLLRFSATPQRCSLRSIIILSLRTLLPPRFLRTLVPPPWFLRTFRHHQQHVHGQVCKLGANGWVVFVRRWPAMKLRALFCKTVRKSQCSDAWHLKHSDSTRRLTRVQRLVLFSPCTCCWNFRSEDVLLNLGHVRGCDTCQGETSRPRTWLALLLQATIGPACSIQSLSGLFLAHVSILGHVRKLRLIGFTFWYNFGYGSKASAPQFAQIRPPLESRGNGSKISASPANGWFCMVQSCSVSMLKKHAQDAQNSPVIRFLSLFMAPFPWLPWHPMTSGHLPVAWKTSSPRGRSHQLPAFGCRGQIQ